jgi:hypothetical protein
MNNEPVALTQVEIMNALTLGIPLYTHPANLTDEVVNKLWAESHEDGIAMQQGFTTQQHYFAHLILKKAREHD